MAKFLTGAKASPRHKLAAATPHVAVPVPSSYAALAPTLSFWGNDQDGDCVTAEEASARAAESTAKGQPEVFVSDAEVVGWADRHGFLNGANLTDVMDAIAADGLTVGATAYCDGPYNSVDWTDYATLCSALYAGPVKIGVASGQLQSVAQGGQNGWWLASATKDESIDHCVGLVGYGSAADCAKLFGAAVPGGVDPAAPCVIMFTWSSYGVVTHEALVAICGEAWLRKTTLNTSPAPVTPPGPPAPNPKPPSHRLGDLLAHVPTLMRMHAEYPPAIEGLLGRVERDVANTLLTRGTKP
jgi:hypothetical protein